MAVDWSKVPAGKSYLDRRTISGEVKYWEPGTFGGGSWQSQNAIDKKRRDSGVGPISQTPSWKNASWNKPGSFEPPTKTQLSPAERTTKERESLKVVDGGKSGFRSLMPKPTLQKGESSSAFADRTATYKKSQELAQRLTQQLRDKNPPVPPTTKNPPVPPTTQNPPVPPTTQNPPVPPTTKNPPVPPTTKNPPVPPTTQNPPVPPTTKNPPVPPTTQKPGSVLRDEPLWDGPGDSSPKPQAQTGDRTKDLTTWANANKNMINTVGTPQQKAILSAAEKGTAMPAPRPISNDIEDIKRMQTASRDRQRVEESYDAYDLVLEYLLSQGHTDTIEEAHYVMMEMDEEIIGNIIDHYIIE